MQKVKIITFRKFNLFGLLLLVNIILVMYSCSVFKKTDNTLTMDYSILGANKMAKQDVMTMISNYHEKQYKAINDQNSPNRVLFSGISPLDSRAVFFNIDTLEKLIYFIKKASVDYIEADKANLGLNIYFASYPDQMSKVHNGHSYVNRHTLVFIPSIFNNSSNMAKDIDLIPNLNGSSTSPQYITKEFLTSPSLSNQMIALGVGRVSETSSTGMSVQNNGTATPPPPKNTLGDTGNPILDLTDPQ